MTFGVKRREMVGALLLACFTSPLAIAACGDAERNNPLYGAIEACRGAQAPLTATQIARLAGDAGETGIYCRAGTTTGISGQDLDPALCSDPGAAVCKMSGGSGTVIDSHCHFTALDIADNNAVPEVIHDRCEVQDQARTFLNGHKSECASSTPEAACMTVLKIRYRAELDRQERAVAYTPDRVLVAVRLFNRVKEKYLALISASTVIPEARKAYLKSRIEATVLRMPPEARPTPGTAAATEMAGVKYGSDAGCHTSTPLGGSTGVYNDWGSENGSIHTVNFCIGAMEGFDSINPYTLILTLGHEISHSIDPCELERDVWHRINASKAGDFAHRGAPGIANSMYPGLLSCLRGGAGADGCSKAPGASAEDPRPFLRCNTAQGVQDYCAEKNYNREVCIATATHTPSCPHGGKDPSYTYLNAASFRQKGEQLSQIGEGFADFMGAEVTSSILREDREPSSLKSRYPGPVDLSGRADAMITMTSEFARLHGVCSKQNTLDEHPAGFIRTNRMMMGSQGFREAIGCGGAMPAADRGGTTCHGL